MKWKLTSTDIPEKSEVEWEELLPDIEIGKGNWMSDIKRRGKADLYLIKEKKQDICWKDVDVGLKAIQYTCLVVSIFPLLFRGSHIISTQTYSLFHFVQHNQILS